MRPSSAATWQISVVAPQPPLADMKPRDLPPPLAPSRRRLRSMLRRSSDFLSGSCKGGYRYSLMPALSEERMASDSAVVLSAMIMGSPAAVRMEATRPSSGSFHPLISTSTTSGRMRSRRSRKLLTSPTSWCSTMMRNGRSARVACACSQSSRFSIASPMVSGYMWSLPVALSLGDASSRRRRQARVHGWGCRGHGYELERLHRGRRSRLACFALLDQLFDRHGIRRRLHRHRSGLIHTRLVHLDIGILGQERRAHVERGQGLSGGNRTHHFRGDDDQQFGDVARRRTAGEELAEQRDVGQAGDFVDGLRHPVVHRAGDDKALSAVEFDFGLHAARAQGGDGSAGDGDRVGVIQRADFRGNLELNGPAGRDAGQKMDANTELAEGYGHRVARGAGLNHGKGELAAGHEAGLLTVDG